VIAAADDNSQIDFVFFRVLILALRAMSYSESEGVAKLIRINSEERQNPLTSSSNHFRVNFGNSTQLMDINRIVIKHVSIPNVQYNIRAASGLNLVGNVFTYFNGALRTITLTPGLYDINSLMAAINADTQAIADGLVLTLNAITKHLTFASVTPITFLSQASGNNMAKVLGITVNSSAGVTSFVAGGLPDLSTHPNLYIASSTLSDGANMISPTLGALPVCAVIPVDQPFGDILHYTTQQEHLDDIHYISYASGKSLQELDLAVYDGDANLVDLQGLDWTIVIRAYQSPPR
jgi:hypothetical protein